MFEKLGGRKFAIAMIILAGGVAIDLVTTRGLSEALMYLMLGILGTFSVTNVANKVATKDRAPELDTSILDEMKERQEQLEQHSAGMQSIVEDLNSQVEAANKRTLAILEQLGSRS
jgi:hypothetical protein